MDRAISINFSRGLLVFTCAVRVWDMPGNGLCDKDSSYAVTEKLESLRIDFSLSLRADTGNFAERANHDQNAVWSTVDRGPLAKGVR